MSFRAKSRNLKSRYHVRLCYGRPVANGGTFLSHLVRYHIHPTGYL